MSIINVIEDWRERRSVGDVKSGGQEIRSWTVLFDENDSPIIRPFLARNAPGIPLYFDQHDADPYCYVQNKVAEAISTTLFKVTVQYGYAEGTSGTGDTNPLSQSDIWSAHFEAQHLPIDSAYGVGTLFGTAAGGVSDSGDDPKWPICNSAGETYDPKITEQFHLLVKRCVGNRIGYDEMFAAEFIGTVNNEEWKGFPPYTVRLTEWSHEQMQAGDLIYQRHTWEFCVKWDMWVRKFLDEGLNEIHAVDSTHPDGLEAIQRDGVDANTPARLDGYGHPLAAGNPGIYRCFRTVRCRNFNLIDV